MRGIRWKVMDSMERLTTDKDVSEMGMFELAHNSCYIEDGVAKYRDFEIDMNVRDLARKLMVQYGHWKSCEEYGLDSDNELLDDDIFDDTMIENLMYETSENIGLIALFYRNLWAMADLRERLKVYEDAEEKGLTIKMPCKKEDIVYDVVLCDDGKYHMFEMMVCAINPFGDVRKGKVWNVYLECVDDCSKAYRSFYDFGKTVFTVKEEAEQALKKMESEG